MTGIIIIWAALYYRAIYGTIKQQRSLTTKAPYSLGDFGRIGTRIGAIISQI